MTQTHCYVVVLIKTRGRPSFAVYMNKQRALQEYKRDVPPNVDFYHVKREDLLEWLSLTMIIWDAFEDNESMIDALLKRK